MADELANNTNSTNTEQATNNADVKTYTQDEVMKLIQAESDKRVTQALRTQQKKYEKELSLSRLDETERARVESEERIAELEQLLAAAKLETNKSEVKSILANRGLSAEFADMLYITDDIQATKANIDNFDKLFKAAVKAEVEKRLGESGGTPKGSGIAPAEAVTKEAAKKMTLAQMQALLDNDPEMYNKLFR